MIENDIFDARLILRDKCWRLKDADSESHAVQSISRNKMKIRLRPWCSNRARLGSIFLTPPRLRNLTLPHQAKASVRSSDSLPNKPF